MCDDLWRANLPHVINPSSMSVTWFKIELYSSTTTTPPTATVASAATTRLPSQARMPSPTTSHHTMTTNEQ